MSDVSIRVQGLSKAYRVWHTPSGRLKSVALHGLKSLIPPLWNLCTAKQGSYYRDFYALKGVELEVRPGEAVGIIGRNGSGKSTLLQIIAGTLTPTTGTVEVNGRVAALLELGSGFNPEFTGAENVMLNAAILGLSEQTVRDRFADICDFAEIGEFIDQPVKTYSSGMMVRLAFAVQAHLDPDVLIVDEALAVGDMAFQSRCLERIERLRKNGTSILLVTHDLATFQSFCDRGILLDQGQVVLSGRASQVAMRYYELIREAEHARQRLPLERAEAEGGSVQLGEDSARAQEQAGEYRFGTGTARIIDFRVMDNHRKEVNALEVDQPFRVAVRVRFFGDVANLALGIMLRNAQGQNLMGMHSFIEHRVDFGHHHPGDVIDIECLQKMQLNPGQYLLHLSIADCRNDHDFVSLDNRSNLQNVVVFGPPLGYGLVHTRPEFTFRRYHAD
jgi:lipopolysaccharide transport system ATP-binding protein